MVSDFLCNNDDNLTLRADLMQASGIGDHKLISSAKFTLDSLKNGLKKIGPFDVAKFQVYKKINFMEYIFGGCSINLHVAIDFTGSNGPPSHPQSLHSLANIKDNQYI